MVMNVLAAMAEVKLTAFFAEAEERQTVQLAAAEAQENARYVTVEDIGRVMIVTETAKQNVKNAMEKEKLKKSVKGVMEKENINL